MKRWLPFIFLLLVAISTPAITCQFSPLVSDARGNVLAEAGIILCSRQYQDINGDIRDANGDLIKDPLDRLNPKILYQVVVISPATAN